MRGVTSFRKNSKLTFGLLHFPSCIQVLVYYSPYGALLVPSAEPVVMDAGEVCIPLVICEPADEITCDVMGIPAGP